MLFRLPTHHSAYAWESEPFKTMPTGRVLPLPGEEGRGALARPIGPAPRRPRPAPRAIRRRRLDVLTRQLPSPQPRAPRPAPRARSPPRRSQPALRLLRSGLGGPDPGSPPPGPAPRPAPPSPAPRRLERTMPQLDPGGGGAGGGDDLGAPDEPLAFQDEGEEQDDKSRDSVRAPSATWLSSSRRSSMSPRARPATRGSWGRAPVPAARPRSGREVSAGPRPAVPQKPRRSIAPWRSPAVPRPLPPVAL